MGLMAVIFRLSGFWLFVLEFTFWVLWISQQVSLFIHRERSWVHTGAGRIVTCIWAALLVFLLIVDFRRWPRALLLIVPALALLVPLFIYEVWYRRITRR